MKGIVLSELLNESEQEKAPKLKPIEYVACLMNDGKWLDKDHFRMTEEKLRTKPHILVQRRFFVDGDDLFLVEQPHNYQETYRGKWNDGVTE
jgi:hypothetical protein